MLSRRNQRRQREYDYGWKSWTQILWQNGTYFDGDVSSW